MEHPTKILDKKWFDRLVAITQTSGETFERLMPPVGEVAAKRRAFDSSGRKTNPNLVASHLDPHMFEANRNKLTKLRDDIARQEPNESIRTAYLERIEELILNHTMLESSAHGNMDAFHAANKAVYGEPNFDVFAAVCQWIRQQAAQASKPLEDRSRQVLDVIPDIRGNAEILAPDQATFDTIRDLHAKPGGYYDQLFGPGNIPNKEHITQQEGDKICERILGNISSDYTLGDSANGLWSVLPSVKKVMRPPGYELDREAFIGIVMHEIGTHLIETINGEKQPLRLLLNGLAGMDRFELSGEGRAFLREQIVYRSPEEYTKQPSWYYRIAIHLANSLACGLYKKEYTFNEVYNVIHTLYDFWNATIDSSAPGQKAHDDAWNMTVRVFKGTNGLGGSYRKDITYLEGNIGCWNIAKTTPERIMLGDLGKFDILNPKHLQILRALKIIT